jgi:hypothetical protein
MAHPYQPFPLARLLEAVQQVPLSDYPPDERRLAQFGLPVRFRYAARPGRHSTSFQSLWLELLASWTVQPGCAVASWARACTWPVPGIRPCTCVPGNHSVIYQNSFSMGEPGVCVPAGGALPRRLSAWMTLS